MKSFQVSKILSFFALLIFCTWPSLVRAGLNEELFFVGEDVRVLTIASRRPEAPKEAPAIASVITAEELRRRGVRTLGEALSYVPGFYLAPKEWGTLPYLRGIPNGILFLYDGVPLTSDSTKNIHPLDEELSLEAISRIEIIRGPGSVLWGPDAFAGIVNIVPKTGRNFQGREAGVWLGSPHGDEKVYLNMGGSRGLLSGFVSLSAYGRDPSPEHYAFYQHRGSIGRAEFYEGVFHLQYADWLQLSGRLSHFRRPFVMSETELGLSWPGWRKTPLSFLKAELEKRFDKTSLRFKGYYSYLHQKHRELDLSTQQKNHLLYGEFLLDRELFTAQGLLTLGLSWRKNYVRDATINVRGFLPEYLSPENPQFSPIVDVADFDTRLFSFFGQYRHHLRKDLDVWAGLRFDDHDQYQSKVSYNLGLGWFPRPTFYLKLLHGTAYRTPYSVQFLREGDPKPEKIKNFSLELSWGPPKTWRLSLTGFYNVVEHHVNEDPFGGFSLPSKEKFLGLETVLSWNPRRDLSLELNFTTFSRWGEKERYRVLDYLIFTPDGTVEEVYSHYEKPFDSGAKKFGNLILSWRPREDLDVNLRLRYVGPRRLYLLQTGESWRFPSYVTGDLTLSKRWARRLSGEIALKNFLDHKAETPGTLAPIEIPRFAAYFILRYRW